LVWIAVRSAEMKARMRARANRLVWGGGGRGRGKKDQKKKSSEMRTYVERKHICA